ncbi:lipoyl(octanoyl) transferase LipB [Anaerorudis cellulosivorans]|uniref:lipoyl(octanoyl) transferase LipB n=1 Tax=Anaerorudis cellulosivorans TaxID=3397862 RepID=UPI00221F33D2|nr:lipoyl(octanoyl) transferase LipB [Seramator thermalis]MCW1734807.1 lipoyl(octanoyl) transferase LipB [Seramator thermalis]
MQKIDEIIDLGTIAYAEAWEYQQKLFDKAIAQKQLGVSTTQTLILCEHPHVITLGKHGNSDNLLLPVENLRKRGVEFFYTDRGGDITYHGPGQLVVYPIFDLNAFEMGLKSYIFNLEEVIIRLLNDYGIKAERMSGATGVWLGADSDKNVRKICAIGVRSSHFVTMHGLALNVNTDLSYFSLINPCGFTEKGVTSIQKELNSGCLKMDEIKNRIIHYFFEIFESKK